MCLPTKTTSKQPAKHRFFHLANSTEANHHKDLVLDPQTLPHSYQMSEPIASTGLKNTKKKREGENNSQQRTHPNADEETNLNSDSDASGEDDDPVVLGMSHSPKHHMRTYPRTQAPHTTIPATHALTHAQC